MSKGWRTCRLGELAEIVGGGTPSSKVPEYWNGDVPWISPSDLSGYNYRYISHGAKSLTTLGLKKSSARLHPPGTLLFTSRAPIGYVAIAANSIATNQGFQSLRVDRTKLNIHFAYYLLIVYTPVIQAFGTGATFPEVSAKKVGQVKVRIPNLNEQEKIARVLSAYDELIENNLKRIKLLEEKAQQTYEEWFVRMRFPGHESTPIDPDTGLPEGWEERDLGDVAKMNVASLKKGFRGNIRYIDISSVGPGVINGHEKFDFAEAPGRARRKAKHGDTIWSCVRPNRKSHALVWSPHEDDVFSTGFCVISPKKRLQLFVHFELKQDRFVDFLMNRATGAAYPAVKQKDFLDYPISIPAQGLVDAFDDEVRPIADFCSSLKSMNTALEEARDILLPRLMTGMIDVEELEVQMPLNP